MKFNEYNLGIEFNLFTTTFVVITRMLNIIELTSMVVGSIAASVLG